MHLCPQCLHPLQAIDAQHFVAWSGFKSIPIQCDNCHNVHWVENDPAASTVAVATEIAQLKHTPVAEKIPALVEETKVYIVNREHPKHLEPGVIIRRSHVHYRIRFLDGAAIWMPEHWIQAVPSEML